MYLQINNIDLSGYITEEAFESEITPVYGAEYTDHRGVVQKRRIGMRRSIRAVLYEVDETTAARLRVLSGGEVSVTAHIPAAETFTADFQRFCSALSRDKDGVRYYTVTIELAGDILDGL